MVEFQYVDDEKLIVDQKVKKIVKKQVKKAEIKSVFDINEMLSELSQTSEFKRLIYKALLGKVHRGSKENLEKELSESITKFRNLL